MDPVPGRPPSIVEIAARCGVSKATVSKALNPNPGRCDIAAPTRARIRRVADELGYRPGLRGRWGRGRGLRGVGLVYGRVAPYLDGVYDRVPQVVGETLLARGYQLLFVPLAGGATWRRQLHAQSIEAAVLMHPLPAGLDAELAADRFPAAALNLDPQAPLHRVLPDDVGGMRAAVDHLHALGHRRIAYVRGLGGDPTAHLSVPVRLEAFHARCAELGIAGETATPPFDERVREPRWTEWLRGSDCTAVVAYSANDAVRARLAADDLGLRVPEQLSIVAIHDTPFLRWHLPALTAVEVPIEAMARRAADLVLDQLEGRLPPGVQRVVLPEPLIVRASSAPPGPRNRVAKRG